MSHGITVFPESSFIRDLCLIRDELCALYTRFYEAPKDYYYYYYYYCVIMLYSYLLH